MRIRCTILLVTIAVLLPAVMAAQSKAVEVRYTMRMAPSEETLSQIPEALREAAREAIHNYTSEHMLYCNQGYYAYATEGNPIKKNRFIVKGNNSYRIDLKQKQITSQKSIDGKDYIVTSPYEPLEWEIGTEEKEILGKRCTKAIHGDNVAWFAEDLPFSAGPNFFYGLPGLILEVTDISTGLNFLATSFQTLQLI